MPNLSEETCLLAAVQGLQLDFRFFLEVNTNPSHNIEDFLGTTFRFMHIEEIVKPGKGKTSEARSFGTCPQDGHGVG